LKYTSVGNFSNNTDENLSINLELLCEEIVLSPGHQVELLIEDVEGALPVSIVYDKNSLQIYPGHADSKWLIRFKGQEIEPGYPTILKHYE